MGEHAEHHMHKHSLLTYDELAELLNKRRKGVADYYRDHGPATDKEAMKALGFVDPNKVRPRVTELVQAGLLQECGSRRDPDTNRTVRLVSYAGMRA